MFTKFDRIVVIGASFGGIDALIRLLSQLNDCNFPIVIAQHLKHTNEQTRLHEVLSKRTGMEVYLASEGMELQAGNAYVAQPGKHLVIKNDKLYLDDGNPVNHVKPAADVLFISAAETYGNKVIGIVLTGTGKDGTKGCVSIKNQGGITIAQDKETSEFFTMPENSIKANAIDFVLPIHEIANKIIVLTQSS
ncbi:CheB methylesterase [Candidatus Magnetomorum sp. HK-1]|nr:CheB methylesterase [Candidatus Magnetomorum sp. HK-1]